MPAWRTDGTVSCVHSQSTARQADDCAQPVALGLPRGLCSLLVKGPVYKAARAVIEEMLRGRAGGGRASTARPVSPSALPVRLSLANSQPNVCQAELPKAARQQKARARLALRRASIILAGSSRSILGTISTSLRQDVIAYFALRASVLLRHASACGRGGRLVVEVPLLNGGDKRL